MGGRAGTVRRLRAGGGTGRVGRGTVRQLGESVTTWVTHESAGS